MEGEQRETGVVEAQKAALLLQSCGTASTTTIHSCEVES